MQIGLDIVEVDRIKRLAFRNKLFLSRVFSSPEIKYCSTKKNKWQHFAVRFAAKEAVWKALSKSGIRLKDISVNRNSQGKPLIFLKGKKAAQIHISLSHSQHYAAAVAVTMK
ncbi:MAG: holo-ACP synthase [Elusimicrobia bacterium]|nr:holo-ACP synthase [Elusimicrobiota bacterium]